MPLTGFPFGIKHHKTASLTAMLDIFVTALFARAVGDGEQQPLIAPPPDGDGITVETLPLEALAQEMMPGEGIGEAVGDDAHAKAE